MEIVSDQAVRGLAGCLCGDGLAVVIDPRRDVDDYLRLARENDLSIAYVLETHRQEDFEFGIPAQAHEQNEKNDPGKPDSARQLVLGLSFGVVFGFLLQKGGVARYEVLMGQCFLTDFTVLKVMLTAIIVGMLGVFSLRALGQGNYDAIAGILGLMAGSYFYAETSGFIGSTIHKLGNRGGIMLPDLLGMRLAAFLAVFVPLLVLGLFVIAQLAP